LLRMQVSAAHTGVRRGEIQSLRWRQIDFPNRTLTRGHDQDQGWNWARDLPVGAKLCALVDSNHRPPPSSLIRSGVRGACSTYALRAAGGASRLYVPVEGLEPRCRRCWVLGYESQSWSYHGGIWHVLASDAIRKRRRNRQRAARCSLRSTAPGKWSSSIEPR
jgi:hypothetical protein